MYEPVEKTEETVAMVLEGAMYYDIEYEDDKWIRIHLVGADGRRVLVIGASILAGYLSGSCMEYANLCLLGARRSHRDPEGTLLPLHYDSEGRPSVEYGPLEANDSERPVDFQPN